MRDFGRVEVEKRRSEGVGSLSRVGRVELIAVERWRGGEVRELGVGE